MEIENQAGEMAAHGRLASEGQGALISAPEEIAFHEEWITKEKLLESAAMYGKSPYGEHLKRVAEGRLLYIKE